MKRIIVILLITLIILPNFSSIVIYISFKLNQEEISNTLCNQKNIINNTCNGRCVLETKLKKLEQTQKNNEVNIKEKSEIVFTLSSLLNQEIKSFIPFTNKKVIFSRPSVYFFSLVNSIFHPPSI